MVLFFHAAANVFVQAPAISLPVAAMFSAVLIISGFIAVGVCWLAFPEFCVDEVRLAAAVQASKQFSSGPRGHSHVDGGAPAAPMTLLLLWIANQKK